MTSPLATELKGLGPAFFVTKGFTTGIGASFTSSTGLGMLEVDFFISRAGSSLSDISSIFSSFLSGAAPKRGFAWLNSEEGASGFFSAGTDGANKELVAGLSNKLFGFSVGMSELPSVAEGFAKRFPVEGLALEVSNRDFWIGAAVG